MTYNREAILNWFLDKYPSLFFQSIEARNTVGPAFLYFLDYHCKSSAPVILPRLIEKYPEIILEKDPERKLLYHAVTEGWIWLVDQILKIDPTAIKHRYRGNSLATVAILGKQYAVLVYLLEQDPSLLEFYDAADHESLAVFACRLSDISIFKLLVIADPPVLQHKDMHGRSLKELASDKCLPLITQLNIIQENNPHSLSDKKKRREILSCDKKLGELCPSYSPVADLPKVYSRTDLFEAAKKGELKLIRVILAQNFQLFYEKDQMGRSVEHVIGNLDQKEVLNQLEDPNTSMSNSFRSYFSELTNWYYSPPAFKGGFDFSLHYAAYRGDIQVVQNILKNRPNGLEERDEYSRYPALLAAGAGQKHVVKWMFKQNSGILHQRDEHYQTTPLLYAAERKRHKTVKCIINLDPTTLKQRDKEAMSAADYAVQLDEQNEKEVLREMLRLDPTIVFDVDHKGRMLAHKICVYQNSFYYITAATELAMVLDIYPEALEQKDQHEKTPLDYIQSNPCLVRLCMAFRNEKNSIFIDSAAQRTDVFYDNVPLIADIQLSLQDAIMQFENLESIVGKITDFEMSEKIQALNRVLDELENTIFELENMTHSLVVSQLSCPVDLVFLRLKLARFVDDELAIQQLFSKFLAMLMRTDPTKHEKYIHEVITWLLNQVDNEVDENERNFDYQMIRELYGLTQESLHYYRIRYNAYPIKVDKKFECAINLLTTSISALENHGKSAVKRLSKFIENELKINNGENNPSYIIGKFLEILYDLARKNDHHAEKVISLITTTHIPFLKNSYLNKQKPMRLTMTKDTELSVVSVVKTTLDIEYEAEYRRSVAIISFQNLEPSTMNTSPSFREEVQENNHPDLDEKIEKAKEIAIALNKSTIWNGPKKYKLVFDVINEIEAVKNNPENLSLTTNEILMQTQSADGKTLKDALGWHRLFTALQKGRGKTNSLSRFEENEIKNGKLA